MSYCPLADLKSTVSLTGNGNDTVLQRLLDVATARIDRYCRRGFGTVTATRLSDAPAGNTLVPAGLQTVTSLTAYGTALTSGVGYLPTTLPDPETGAPVVTLVRLDTAGDPRGWDDGSLVKPYGAISITGTWNAAVPAEIVQACEMMAARLWAMRKDQYARESGNSALGRGVPPSEMLTATIRDLLAPYVLIPIDVVIGQDEAA